MTYRDDPIFEDYRVVRNPEYNVRRPNAYSVTDTTAGGHGERSYRIIDAPEYNIKRASGGSNFDNKERIVDSPEEKVRYNIVATDPEPRSNWFRKILKTFSQYGMNYENDVLKNVYAIPGDPNLLPHQEAPQDIYSKLLQWRKKSNEDQSFFEKDLNYRREILRKIAQQPELEDILDIMCNEAIVYDSDNAYICQPYIDTNIIETLTDTATALIKDTIDKAFYKFYMLLDWKTRAWDEFKRYLIDGVLAYEIVYDSIEHPH